MDRKIYWGAIAGIFTTFVTGFVERRYGIELTVEVQGFITVLATSIIGWLIPLAEGEIKKRLTNKIVYEAMLDQDVSVDIPSGVSENEIAVKLAEEESRERLGMVSSWFPRRRELTDSRGRLVPGVALPVDQDRQDTRDRRNGRARARRVALQAAENRRGKGKAKAKGG